MVLRALPLGLRHVDALLAAPVQRVLAALGDVAMRRVRPEAEAAELDAAAALEQRARVEVDERQVARGAAQREYRFYDVHNVVGDGAVGLPRASAPPPSVTAATRAATRSSKSASSCRATAISWRATAPRVCHLRHSKLT